jgi:hypothetical protein
MLIPKSLSILAGRKTDHPPERPFKPAQAVEAHGLAYRINSGGSTKQLAGFLHFALHPVLVRATAGILPEEAVELSFADVELAGKLFQGFGLMRPIFHILHDFIQKLRPAGFFLALSGNLADDDGEQRFGGPLGNVCRASEGACRPEDAVDGRRSEGQDAAAVFREPFSERGSHVVSRARQQVHGRAHPLPFLRPGGVRPLGDEYCRLPRRYLSSPVTCRHYHAAGMSQQDFPPAVVVAARVVPCAQPDAGEVSKSIEGTLRRGAELHRGSLPSYVSLPAPK